MPGSETNMFGHDECVICGYKNPWSLGMRFVPDDDETVCGHFRGTEALQGYEGLLHGGVLASLLDSAMVHCLFHRGVRAVTGDLHVRYIQPVSCNAEVDVRAHITSATPPLYYLRAEILAGDQVMVWGEATFIRTPRNEAGPASRA